MKIGAGIFVLLGVFYLNFEYSAAWAEDCLGCHDTVVAKPFVHEAIIMGGCTSCHESHSTTTRFAKRLIKGDDLCFDCHEEKLLLVGGRGHPVSNHPVMGGRDRLYPENKFTCVSCHNPHSSENANLFRYSYGKDTPHQGSLCTVCHSDSVGFPDSGAGHLPTPPWNR